MCWEKLSKHALGVFKACRHVIQERVREVALWIFSAAAQKDRNECVHSCQPETSNEGSK